MNDHPASYRPSLVKEYKGHPLIEALSPLEETEAELNDQFTVRPDYDPAEREHPARIRVCYVDRIKSLCVPFEHVFSLEALLNAKIRRGYLWRNPLNAAVQGYLHSDQEAPRLLIAERRANASTLFISGLSGAGKTTSVEAVLRSLGKQVIRHTSYQGKALSERQILWIKVNCPEDASLKGVCYAIFSTIDEVLGDTDFAVQYADPRLARRVLVQGIRRVAATYHLGALIIDEIQNLAVGASGGTHEVLGFFLNLRDELGIPIVIIGTYASLRLFSGQFRLGRRLAEGGELEIAIPTSADDESWKLLCDSLWEFQWVKNPAPMSATIRETLFELCAGINGVAVALCGVAQKEAILSEVECVDDKYLRYVWDLRMRELSPAIAALRSGNKDLLSKFDDLYRSAMITIEGNQTQGASSAAQNSQSGDGTQAGNKAKGTKSNNKTQKEPPPPDALDLLMEEGGYEQLTQLGITGNAASQ